jgi:hypothetical protein
MVQSTVPSGPPLLKEGLNLSLSKLSLVFDLNQWTRDLIWGVMDARCKFILDWDSKPFSGYVPVKPRKNTTYLHHKKPTWPFRNLSNSTINHLMLRRYITSQI